MKYSREVGGLGRVILEAGDKTFLFELVKLFTYTLIAASPQPLFLVSSFHALSPLFPFASEKRPPKDTNQPWHI